MKMTAIDRAVSELFAFLRPGGGYHYGIVFKDPETEELSLHKMTRQPCLGELRPYKEDGDNIYRPSDLTAPWPKTGNPVAVGITLGWWFVKDISEELRDIFFGPDGPWGKAFPFGCLFETAANGSLIVVTTETNVNPDILVNAFGVARSISVIRTYYENLRKAGAEPKEALDAVLCGAQLSDVSTVVSVQSQGVASWFQQPDFKKVISQSPDTFTKKSFYDRGAYHRPKIEYLWAGKQLIKQDDKFKKPIPVDEFLSIFRGLSA